MRSRLGLSGSGFLIACVGGLAVFAPCALWSQAAVPVSLRDYSERRFASTDGLRSLAVFAVEVLPDESLWVGTDAGAHRFVSGRFERVPLPIGPRHVRTITMSDDGTVWFGTRTGAVSRTSDGATRLYDAADGLPSGTVYSLLMTNAVGGTRRLTAAAASGLAQFNGRTWDMLPFPAGLAVNGPVLRARPRDGAPDELWLATAGGRIAVWRDGAWRQTYGAAQGLRARSVEQLMVSPDSSHTLFAGTDRGVARLVPDTAGGRWVEVVGAPRLAYRLASIPDAQGNPELWVGTLDGLLMRQRGADWDTVNLRSTEPRTPVHALTGVRGHAGGFAVYVGTFGDGVVRLSVGRAATLVSEQAGLRRSIRAVLEQPFGVPNLTWVATSDVGVIEIAGNTARTVADVEDLGDGRASALFVRPPRAPQSDVWVGAALGAFQRVNERWLRRDAGLGETTVSRFALEDERDTTSALLAATDSGAMRWDGRVWERLAGTPASVAYDVLGAQGDDSTVWVSGGFGVRRRVGERWQADRVPVVEEQPLVFRRLCRLRAGPAATLLGASAFGVYVRRAIDSTWHPLPLRMRSFFRSEHVYDLRCDDAARVMVATSDGVAVLDLASPDSASWRMLTMLGPTDGLPSPVMYAIGEGGAPGTRWIGTAHGVGRVDARALPPPDKRLFTMAITSGANGDAVDDGGVVAAVDNRIQVRLALPTFHREEDLRYRIEMGGRSTPATDVWNSNSEVTYPALQPGAYAVQAWARDHAGREYGPVTQRFTVAHPPLRSPVWQLVYAALFAGALAFLYRWRLRLLHDRATALQESEQRTKASERQFRALFESAFDAKMVVRERRVQAANASAARLFGKPVETLIGQSVDELGFAELPPVSAGAVEAADTHVVRGDGRRVPVTLTITEVELGRHATRHWVVRDLSATREAEEQRRALEAQVREAQKLESLGTLAGGVAHDFNNLLGVIRGNAELARDSLSDPDSVADHLAAVLDASERARDLVRQILTFSRRSAPHTGVVDLAAVVRALQPMLRSLIPRTVELTVIGGDGTYPVRGDVTQLQQLFFNLCSNAEYAMRPTNGGRLRVSLSGMNVPTELTSEFVAGTTRVVRLRVSDTGVGMSREVRERVFEPFFTTKPTGEGTGLGLSVLHGVVASHLGHVHLESHEGRGTTFDVYFPLVDAETADVQQPTPVLGTAAVTPAVDAGVSDAELLRGARVVLVDDEPSVARVMERALTRLGCTVRVHANPERALEALRAAPDDVDLVLTDQTMPGMTGDVLAEAIAHVRPTLPVVIVTGYSYRLTPERLAEVGAWAVLQKPVPLSELTLTVAGALRGGRAAVEFGGGA